MNYDFKERKEASNFMAEKTNEVLGIVASNSMKTKKSKRLVKELNDVIAELDFLIKFELLPKESETVGRSNNGTLTPLYITEAVQLKQHIDLLLQRAYSLEAQIKTALT
jgi:hypothetical protein